ncbi:DNA replication/repair protein RecF [Clostridium botulinum]|nr:DNA replication/repair protein RecF [Clostridium botulinum]NFH91215.1 DNA replication/repair protein RecF [Clostridium botulinum]NFI18477.1 DNA replication/repair protein RecF [Clostridium botulinum]NFL93482.1 DNA replication/repair protein RecF [Clostridium botulinum]NFN52635.1 DNA replication/repair protein RecF [Clostridium botulinum]
MYIKAIMLANYRNYNNLELNLSEGVNVFIGDNAQGKTNVLESIYYCAFAKSHRTSRDKDLINWKENEAYISLLVGKKRLDKRIDIKILRDGKKAIKVNSIKINKIGELFGTFNVVMFSPEDLKIIKESPGIRRKFLDMELCQISKKYYFNLVQYNKILNERNVILRSRDFNKDILEVYDLQLVECADYIVKERLEYIDKINYYGKFIHNEITSGKEDIVFKYDSGVKFKENFKYAFLEKLRNNLLRDREQGITSVGPHRDDFNVLINNIDVKKFGSQGQQRTAVLTMKFSSLKIIKEITKEYPILLLDDVLSELDINRKRYVLSTLSDIQTIITCTGINDLEDYLDDKSKVFNVCNGEIVN